MKRRKGWGGRRVGAGRPRLYASAPATTAALAITIARAAPDLLALEVEAAHGLLKGRKGGADAGRARRALLDRFLGKAVQPIEIPAPVDVGEQVDLFEHDLTSATSAAPARLRALLARARGAALLVEDVGGE